MDYFKITNVGDGIFRIFEPGGVYTTLIVGENRAMLIDTGYGYGDLATVVESLTDKPFDVVLTHGHTDHCGGNYQFPEVHMNMADVTTYLWYETTQKKMIIDKFRRDRAEAGLPDVWPTDFDDKKYMKAHTHHFEELTDGQIFDLGGRQEEIIFMPGHTVGSIVVLDSLTGTLVSGDNIADSLWIFFDTSAPLSQYASKLMDIMKRPVTAILASHCKYVLPPAIMNDILTTIGCIDPDQDKEFKHPRTGQPGTRHREACTCVDEIEYIYVVYDKNRL